MSDIVWKALASPCRRRILEALQGGPHNVTKLSLVLGRSRFTVAQHLGVLERAGLIEIRSRGRARVASLDTRPLHATVVPWVSSMTELFSPDWLRSRGFDLPRAAAKPEDGPEGG